MNRTDTHKEFHTGTNGNGHTVYMIVTVIDETGEWKWVERFDTEGEAQSWMRWA